MQTRKKCKWGEHLVPCGTAWTDFFSTALIKNWEASWAIDSCTEFVPGIALQFFLFDHEIDVAKESYFQIWLSRPPVKSPNLSIHFRNRHLHGNYSPHYDTLTTNIFDYLRPKSDHCLVYPCHTLPPKDPYWKKYIIKISMSMGRYKSCWPKREPREAWMTLWAFRPEVSSLWAWYVAKSNMITWQKVRVVLWSL